LLSFKTLAGKRVRTKTFGEGSPRDNECDMVDIGDMADELSDLYPDEAEAVIAALEDCVLYNRHNSSVPLSGLSTYYIYGGRTLGEDALTTYATLPVSPAYTAYLRTFYSALTGEQEQAQRLRNTNGDETVKTEFALWEPVRGKPEVYRMAALKDVPGSQWPHFNGHPVCMFPVAKTERTKYYAIPAEINGRDCDIIAVINDANPKGLVEGARNFTGTIIQKGYDPINPGDKITLYSPEFDKKNPGSLTWKKLPEFKMGDNALILNWKPTPKGYQEGGRLTNLYGEVEYSVF
jgi:hypothetical protein